MPQLDLSWYFLNFILSWAFFLFFVFRCYSRSSISDVVFKLTVESGKGDWENSLWSFF